MRGSILLAAAALLACAGVLGTPGRVHAECPWFAVPPATEAARSAREVIVGTVVENIDGYWFDFRIRIGGIRHIDNLYPGWPFAHDDQGRPWPPCEPIPGWKGNVIALALDALAPDGTTRYNAASWIAGRLPFNRDVHRTTLEAMRRLADLPNTDTTPPADSRPPLFAGTTGCHRAIRPHRGRPRASPTQANYRPCQAAGRNLSGGQASQDLAAVGHEVLTCGRHPRFWH